MTKSYRSILSTRALRAVSAVAVLLGAWNTSAVAAVQPGVDTGNKVAAPAVFAVVHVDVEPKDMTAAIPLLASYAQQARHDPAVLHIDVLQQNGGNNHFTLLEDFRSEAAYKQFVAQGYVKHMRDSIQPMLGSPFDERLHSEITVR